MLIYFLRHAEAEGCAESDFDRRLTTKGLEQADKVGKFCARYGMVPDIILTSPVIRAKQTAELAAKRLGDPAVTVEQWIACGMSAETCLDELRAFEKFPTVMVVGHEPDFSEVIAAMTGMLAPDHLHIRKASLTAVDLRTHQRGAGRLEFSIPVRLM